MVLADWSPHIGRLFGPNGSILFNGIHSWPSAISG
jgi:hypothetical protein